MTARTHQETVVALEGGPRNGCWFLYRDWLALRKSSRRGRYPLDHPCGASRCYLPTDRMAENTDPAVAELHRRAQVWEYIPPAQWIRWGREYSAPEEAADPERTCR